MCGREERREERREGWGGVGRGGEGWGGVGRGGEGWGGGKKNWVSKGIPIINNHVCLYLCPGTP